MKDAAPAELVRVRRHWNDYRIATVRLAQLTGLHWSSTSGGVGVNSPRPMISGYVYCDQVIEGELAHSCSHGPAPHRISVVVVQKDNPKPLIKSLKARADVGDRR